MRTMTENNITIQYADEIGFAFMPCILKATGTGITSIAITLVCQGEKQVCKADAFNNGDCILDYRAFVQSILDGIKLGTRFYEDTYRDHLGEVIVCSVSVMSNETELLKFSFETFYVWGAMRYGETWGGCQHLTCFRNYPFTFGLYAHSWTKILIGYEGAPQKAVDVEERGIWNFSSRILPRDARYSIIYSYDGEIKKATFDNIFDLTFYLNSGGAQEKLLRIDYDDSDEGIYLRWLDRHGFYRYWLFVAGEEQREVSSDGEFMRNNLMAYNGISGWVGAYGRKGCYNRVDKIPLCAPSVDGDTFDMLQDIATSPVVDMFLGGDYESGEDMWQSVTVETETYTKTGAPLQDFVCTMTLNDINIQRL